jgi:hypothetical protein
MADIDMKPAPEEMPPEGEYTVGELVFWIGGALLIPIVPILMIIFLTPHSGM